MSELCQAVLPADKQLMGSIRLLPRPSQLCRALHARRPLAQDTWLCSTKPLHKPRNDAALRTCRFKHSSAAQQLDLHRRHPRLIPAICRLISIPVLVFGPGIGVPAAILMFGVQSPESVRHAMTIRKWSAWVSRRNL